MNNNAVAVARTGLWRHMDRGAGSTRPGIHR